MPADSSGLIPSPTESPPGLVGRRDGVALLWAVLGIVTTGLFATAALFLFNAERMVNENYESGMRALFAADQALSQFYADFTPTDNLLNPIITETEIDIIDQDTVLLEMYADYTGADLKVADLEFQDAFVRVTPTKLVESQHGDVYMLEAEASIEDTRADRPMAVRRLRTYAELVPPFRIRAALTAPNGLTGLNNGSGRLTLDGGKVGECGSGQSVPPLATPAGEYSLKNKKIELKASASGIGHDTTATTYQELKDSVMADWDFLTDTANFAGAGNFVIPSEYASLQAIPWNTLNSSSIWPLILVQGNVNITTKVKGFGLLVVEGGINIDHDVLDWRGIIISGKGLVITDNPAKAHLHMHGAVITGMDCSVGEIISDNCRTILNGEHLGVSYSQCDAEAAWAGMLTIRPLTPSRHTRLF